MYNVDTLHEITTEIDGKWVIARPIKQGFIIRFKDAIQVLKGNAEAVKFYKQ